MTIPMHNPKKETEEEKSKNFEQIQKTKIFRTSSCLPPSSGKKIPEFRAREFRA